jgi:hypothetical protein
LRQLALEEEIINMELEAQTCSHHNPLLMLWSWRWKMKMHINTRVIRRIARIAKKYGWFYLNNVTESQ